MDVTFFKSQAANIISKETFIWIRNQMAKLTFTTIRNLIVASIYMINPLRMRVLIKMLTSNYLNGQITEIVIHQCIYL